MNIGALASQSGIAAKTIRYYEDIGLVPSARRLANGYRDYSPNDVQTLRFIHRARHLGFSLEEIGQLLELWNNRRRSSASVKSLAVRHIAEIDRKITEMRSLRRALNDLVQRCHGDERPECPILDDLAREPGTVGQPAGGGAPRQNARARRINHGKAAVHQ